MGQKADDFSEESAGLLEFDVVLDPIRARSAVPAGGSPG
jgi:hypothetical protein